MSAFLDKLAAATARNHSLLCVGLDPDPTRVPAPLRDRADWVARFNAGIIEATADLVCAYKPNLAFYEALGAGGMAALRATLRAIPPEIPVLLDAKRGDIGSSAARYAAALFDELGADAATVCPYMGYDAVQPFLEYRERGVFVLVKTSNPGAADFQDLPVSVGGVTRPLFVQVAQTALGWNRHGNLGLVVGATQPGAFHVLRELAPDVPLLVPGVGAQRGELETAVREGRDRRGAGLLVAVSRAILYAANGAGWQAAARAAARTLRDTINTLREA
ncbi:MAG: orotidine-5'-phosphate decarboxylase [Chloroflexi bacterium]|nr:orotidine-5'-phosphate decarboxylase [Chloroflexota bacterium]